MGVAVELACWWAATVGVWMVSLSAWSAQDLEVAACCAVPCAALAAAARRAVPGAWRPPGDVWRAVLLLPAAVVTDTVRVWLTAWRPGGASTMTFRHAQLRSDRRAAQQAGRRALSSVLLSSTPGTYVIDIDPDDRTVLLHSVGSMSALERAVMR